MKFGRPRTFVNDFSIAINGLNENDYDGILITIERFRYYLSSISENITKENARIEGELKKENTDIRLDMMRQFDVETKLNHFLNLLLRSAVVSIYSYFEHSLYSIANVCETYLKPSKKLKTIKHGPLIKRYYDFINQTNSIKNKKTEAAFREILIWNKLRNDIVHNNGQIDRFKSGMLSHKSIEVKVNQVIFKDVDVIIEFLELIALFLADIIDKINTKHKLIEYS